MSRVAWVLVVIAGVSSASYYGRVHRANSQALKAAAAVYESQVVAAAEKGFKAGYEKGLRAGRLEPSPKACFGWWFGPENTKDRVQQTRDYLCKSQVR